MYIKINKDKIFKKQKVNFLKNKSNKIKSNLSQNL